MTKIEWYDLIQSEFQVSRNVAKSMFHEMIRVKESKGNAMTDALKKAGVEWQI